MVFLKRKRIIIEGRNGQTFLVMTILIGGIVVAAGILLSFLVFSYIDSGYGLQASYAAEAAATAGVEDALLQLTRNGSFSSAGYSVSAGTNTAMVTVTQNISSSTVTVLSSATVSLRTRKIKAIVAEDPTTNHVTLISWYATQ